jgi:hypothetical protein
MGRILLGSIFLIPSLSFCITSLIGRLVLTGMTADLVKNRLHLPRSYCISLVAILFIISQIMAVLTDDVTDLWKASLALGLAYGSMFGLFPAIVFEWFGMRKSFVLVFDCLLCLLVTLSSSSLF